MTHQKALTHWWIEIKTGVKWYCIQFENMKDGTGLLTLAKCRSKDDTTVFGLKGIGYGIEDGKSITIKHTDKSIMGKRNIGEVRDFINKQDKVWSKTNTLDAFVEKFKTFM